MKFSKSIENFIHNISNILPGILGAVVVFVIGWLTALLIRKVVYRLMKKTEWDERLFGNTILDTNRFIANLAYYTIMLIVLLVVLEMMGVSYVLDPIRHMLSEFLGFIPNILAGLTIAFIGYVIARFISSLVKMTGSFLDRLADGMGFKETKRLVSFIQQVVFLIVFIPFIIQALNALHLEAITNPANHILHEIMSAIPNVIGAMLIVVLFTIGGRFLTVFLKDLLVNLNIDNLTKKLHLHLVLKDQSLSKFISNIVLFFLVFFGVVTGIEMLGFDRLTQVLHNMLNLAGDVLFGVIVIVVGNYIATSVYNSVDKSKDDGFVAKIARMAIIGLFLAIALRTMGIANSIVELAFGLTLGAVAVVIALAYGLGGREAAGKHMERILNRFQKKNNS